MSLFVRDFHFCDFDTRVFADSATSSLLRKSERTLIEKSIYDGRAFFGASEAVSKDGAVRFAVNSVLGAGLGFYLEKDEFSVLLCELYR